MRVLKRRSLPDKLNYNGVQYGCNIGKSALVQNVNQAKREGAKVVVQVMSKQLEGKLDLHGQPYKPSVFIFEPVEK